MILEVRTTKHNNQCFFLFARLRPARISEVVGHGSDNHTMVLIRGKVVKV